MGGCVARTGRFQKKIEMTIRVCICGSFDELLAEVGVSKVTLKRDLGHLRYRIDALIVHHRFEHSNKLQLAPPTI